MSQKNIDEFYDLCLQSKKWEKWINKDFDLKNKKNLIMVCGHYLFSNNEFLKIKNKISENIDKKIYDTLKNTITKLPY
jgi:hypothetical protein